MVCGVLRQVGLGGPKTGSSPVCWEMRSTSRSILWERQGGDRSRKGQAARSHMKTLKSLITPGLDHFFFICTTIWHQDNNSEPTHMWVMLFWAAGYPNYVSRAGRHNREPVQDGGPSGVALNCQLVGLWALSVAAMVRYNLFFGKRSQIRKKNVFYEDNGFYRGCDLQIARSPHFVTAVHCWYEPTTLFPWAIIPGVPLERSLTISENWLRFLRLQVINEGWENAVHRVCPV